MRGLDRVNRFAPLAWIQRLPPAKRRVVYALLLGLGVSVFVTVSSRLGSLGGWETSVVDTFLYFRPGTPSPDTVLVVVDEAAFQELGERQPLSRRYLADLAEVLMRAAQEPLTGPLSTLYLEGGRSGKNRPLPRSGHAGGRAGLPRR